MKTEQLILRYKNMERAMIRIVRKPKIENNKPFFIFRDGKVEITNPENEMIGDASDKVFVNESPEMAWGIGYNLVGIWLI
jgi:hypothetical protein